MMKRNYFLVAWRNITRNKVYSAINITGLSIGLACCMLIILYSRDEVSYDRFHTNLNQIYRIVHTDKDRDGKLLGSNGITGMMPAPAFKRNIPEIASFVRLNGYSMPVRIGKEIYEQEGMYADENFFDVFSFPFLSGNKTAALKDLHSVVITEQIAKKFFNTTDAIGKTLELSTAQNPDINGSQYETFTVTGVMPVSPQNSSIKLEVVIPMKIAERNDEGSGQWHNFFLNSFIVLHPQADVKKVEAKMQEVYEREAKAQIIQMREEYDDHTTWHYSLQPFAAMHLSKEFPAENGLKDGSSPLYTKILGGIALFMLLIACINFVNLSVARSLKRAKEIGVRKVIGGDRKQLIQQFLSESFLLSLFSFLLAIAITVLVLPMFNTLANKALSFSYLLTPQLIITYIGLFVLTALLAGFYPALVLSGYSPVQTLYNRMPLSGKNYLSKSLVVLQFSLTTFLIIATITIYHQFNYLTSFNLGYNDQNLVVVEGNAMKADKLKIFREELMQDPSIMAVAARQRGNWNTIAKADGKEMNFAMDIIDTAFLPALEIPVVQGRNFSGSLTTDSTHSVLVNEAFMQAAGWKDLTNRQVDFFYNQKKYDVVGVVKNYHHASLLEEIKPQLFIMDPRYNYGQLLIRVKAGDYAATLKHIEKVFKAHQPLVPFKYEFKSAINEKQYEAENKWKQIISFAAILTIFISCIGLFGLASLAAEKRVKEIGIRKVLGASAGSIARMLSNSFLKLVCIAAAVAFPFAWWAMNSWLQNYPYRVQMNAWVFALALLLVATIALCTISFQAIKAAIANPVKSLRTE